MSSRDISNTFKNCFTFTTTSIDCPTFKSYTWMALCQFIKNWKMGLQVASRILYKPVNNRSRHIAVQPYAIHMQLFFFFQSSTKINQIIRFNNNNSMQSLHIFWTRKKKLNNPNVFQFNTFYKTIPL